MGRAVRVTPGDVVYHVLNRANGRPALFGDEGDYAAFEHVLAEAQHSGNRPFPDHMILEVSPMLFLSGERRTTL